MLGKDFALWILPLRKFLLSLAWGYPPLDPANIIALFWLIPNLALIMGEVPGLIPPGFIKLLGFRPPPNLCLKPKDSRLLILDCWNLGFITYPTWFWPSLCFKLFYKQGKGSGEFKTPRKPINTFFNFKAATTLGRLAICTARRWFFAEACWFISNACLEVTGFNPIPNWVFWR